MALMCYFFTSHTKKSFNFVDVKKERQKVVNKQAGYFF